MDAGDLTEYYLVNLLCQYVRFDSARMRTRAPLALQLGRALDSGGVEQRARLRSLGDFSLFMSGFFSDSFRRSLVDVDYYKSMGEYAYGSLSRAEDDAFAEVFGELSRKFVGFMDVLADISERSALGSSKDVLRLYEKWLRTGSAAGRAAARRARHPPQSVDRDAVSSVVSKTNGRAGSSAAGAPWLCVPAPPCHRQRVHHRSPMRTLGTEPRGGVWRLKLQEATPAPHRNGARGL